jgi:hypothetical protein
MKMFGFLKNLFCKFANLVVEIFFVLLKDICNDESSIIFSRRAIGNSQYGGVS